jgi:Protein of unknown function (DUF1064)
MATMPLADLLGAGWRAPKRTLYGGVMWRSKDEANEAARLDLKLKAGRIRAWSRAPLFPLVVNGVKIGRYTPDFAVTHLDGREELLEVKGGLIARDFRIRWLLFRALYPDRWITALRNGQAFDPLARKKSSTGTAKVARRMVSSKRSPGRASA